MTDELSKRTAGPALPVFDTHFHIIDPRFPVMENQGFLPPVFTVDDYRARTAEIGRASCRERV